MSSALGPQGSTREWRRLRAMTLAAQPLCAICQAQQSTEVDHIVPRERGGNDAPANLRALCEGCHAKVTAEQTRRRAERARRLRGVPFAGGVSTPPPSRQWR